MAKMDSRVASTFSDGREPFCDRWAEDRLSKISHLCVKFLNSILQFLSNKDNRNL